MRLSQAAVAGAVVAVVAGGGYAAYAENSGTAASYRTAVVSTGDVEQTLALSGTLAPAGRSDLAFTTSGTVAHVGVTVGRHVKAGQVLARLDRTALTAALARAQAQLDSAKARLASDEDAQASAAASGVTTSTATPTGAATHAVTPKPSASGPAGVTDSALLSQIRQQQTAVTSGQTAASNALSDATSALAAEQQACTTTASASATASDTASASASDTATADPSGQAGDSSGSGRSDASACGEAVGAVQQAQATVDGAQRQLQQALDALATTLSAAAAQPGQSGPSGQGSGGAQPQTKPSSRSSSTAGSSPATGSGSGRSGSGSRTVTAATLASDQADIDSAQASLVTAQQALAGAALRAPHEGTVAEVDVAAGGTASAGTTAIVVLSPGATDVAVTVTSTQVEQLKVGQVAEVTPAGAGEPLPGTITRITPVPDSSGDYPVTVTLGQDGLDLPAGGAAAVDVVVRKATGVLTVPTSAVSDGTVEVLHGTTLTRTRVKVGVIGPTRTQISSGLARGQEVVLADLDAAVPTSDQQNGFGRFGGAGLGGFGGGTRGGGFRAPGGGIAVPKG